MNSATKKVSEKTTIQGTIPVTVKATPSSTSDNNLLHVQLVDTASVSFNAFQEAKGYENSLHSSTGQIFEVVINVF